MSENLKICDCDVEKQLLNVVTCDFCTKSFCSFCTRSTLPQVKFLYRKIYYCSVECYNRVVNRSDVVVSNTQRQIEKVRKLCQQTMARVVDLERVLTEHKTEIIRLNILLSHSQEEIARTHSDVHDLERMLKLFEAEDFDRNALVTNIPRCQLNAQNVFAVIARVLKYPTDNNVLRVQYVNVVGMLNIYNMIVEFRSWEAKTEFMRCKIRYGDLYAEALGIKAINSMIYEIGIRDEMSARQLALYRKVRELQRRLRFQYVGFLNGRILLRRRADVGFEEIEQYSDLCTLHSNLN